MLDDEENENEAGMDVSVSPTINPGVEDGQEDSDSELQTPTQSKKQIAKKNKMKNQSSKATNHEMIERPTKARKKWQCFVQWWLLLKLMIIEMNLKYSASYLREKCEN